MNACETLFNIGIDFDPAALALPDDDIAALVRAWHDLVTTYRPATLGEAALVEQMYRNQLDLRRASAVKTTRLRDQVREAFRDFEIEQQDQLQAMIRVFEVDAGAAVRLLKRTAAGARELVARWTNLQKLLERNATWYGTDSF